MTPSQDASALRSHDFYDPAASIRLPKRGDSPASLRSSTTLPYRRSNSSLHSLYASTTSLASSYDSSGSVTPTASVVPGSVFSPGRQNGTQSPINAPVGGPDEPRNLILRGFAPHVAVLASKDAEEFIHAKGFPGGLLELLRPFGESIPGKVTIRDSVGASKSWEDFGVRFTAPADGLVLPTVPGRRSADGANGFREGGRIPSHASRTGGNVEQIEEVVNRHLEYAEMQSHDLVEDYMNHKSKSQASNISKSPFYTLYLRRLLSGLPVVPHETFAHPVSCILAISSRDPSPIEELRRLYDKISSGEYKLPQWVNSDYVLRYYVLIHDDEQGDIAKSNSLYEQMKRHFGLHCHLLRLKSNQCIPSDDDSVRHPKCEWISAAEEMAEIQKRETTDDIEDPTPWLFDSDMTAIRTFIRELVAQSIIPTMERNAAQWNEHIASRRRGISGRFMSLSKRWTPFSSSRTSSSPTSSSSSSNYDSLQGFYRADAPEALMRKLADYAFMLRDFKLALSIYDLLRTDFNNDKAWRHYAAANEMAAIAALMSTQPLSSKTRTENIDTWLETALYTYIARAESPRYFALRGLVLGLELLRLRGSSAADDAARWGQRIIDDRLVGSVGKALFQERISACYAVRQGVGTMKLGSRRRKAAMWAALASEEWINGNKALQAEKNLERARALYSSRPPLILSPHAQAELEAEEETPHVLPFESMRAFFNTQREDILEIRTINRGLDGEEFEGEEKEDVPVVEEVSETLSVPRSHRKSLIGGVVPALQMDTGPLSPIRAKGEEVGFKDDNFE